jgi:outer membrane immunogenic protein
MMRSQSKILLLAGASSLALVHAAAAADKPVTKAPPPIAANWTGPYAGLNIGYARHRANFEEESVGSILFALNPTVSLTQTGLTAGGQIGYNWQVQNYVYGLEADFNWVGGSDRINPTPFISASTKLDWFSTLRVRAGFVINPLFYVTGGLAIGHVKNTWDNSVVSATQTDFVSEKTRIGYALGGGIEHMFASNLTGRIEVLYVNFGRYTQSSSVTTITYTSEFRNAAIIARGAFNLKW